LELFILACCAVLVLYHHVGYPILLRLLASQLNLHENSPVGHASASAPGLNVPSVGLLIPAHNEERVIRPKIINCAELDYPPAKLAITVALDGCKDNTELILRDTLDEFENLNVRTVIIEDNIGKVRALNRLIPEIKADIIALSDASALLNADAIEKAVAHFTDPRVGVVCGTYLMPDDAAPGERAYWHYQIQIKSCEAMLGAPMGAHGAFYLFRRELWTPLEADTINDDFVLPMRMVAAGWKAVYDCRIIAREMENTNPRQDFRRRVRIGAGNLQQAMRLWRLANPKHLGIAFVFVSGKGLRAFMPFVLLTGFAASVMLALSGGSIWSALAGVGVGLGLLSFAAAVVPWRLPRAIDAFSGWMLGYLASGLGALLLLSGHGRKAWHLSKTGLLRGNLPDG
jgi:cellulose synthase/poly-beta-1,6-N-acetylglucosamine synthase-like glycosyltransferase